MRSMITLQVKGADGYTNVKSVSCTDSGAAINHGVTFSVSSKKSYRIKITIKATDGKSTYTKVDYRKLIVA